MVFAIGEWRHWSGKFRNPVVEKGKVCCLFVDVVVDL